MSDNNMLALLEQASDLVTNELPSVDKTRELSELVKAYELRLDIIARISNMLKQVSEEADKINKLLIPDLFNELGIKKLTMSDGRTVEIKSKFVGSITEERRDYCLQWLRDNGYESIIKHEVKVKLKKEEQEEYKRIIEGLGKLKVSYDDKQFVHPKTLESFIKERMENPEDADKFPMLSFGVTELRSTIIK